ncbi:McbB family protein [Streptococcus salivarius]|jgi:hypothetical protein|uniref:McbB family protein n=1 Tax=Streptococcus salivarius TaxID=1304 RepID=UPI000E50A35C|nr:McbB family protein [Streptococcus salivarius]RGR60169.1 McbB family protein [Streptococcus salivarius]
MQYNVYQFVITDLENYLVIQNCKGITVLKDKKIIDFFKELDRDNRPCVSQSFLETFFGCDTDSVIDYLINSNLLYKEDKKRNFETVRFLSNNNEFLSSAVYNNKEPLSYIIEEEVKISSTDFLDYFKNISRGDSSLFVISLIPFDYNDFLKIINILQEKDVMFAFVISYNSSLYLTNVYKKSWYNPCPKCFFAHLEASLRSYGRTTGTNTFQTVIDLLYNNRIKYSPNLPLTSVVTLQILSELFQMKKTDINELSSRIVQVNEDTGITYDSAVHWELCDCFE